MSFHSSVHRCVAALMLLVCGCTTELTPPLSLQDTDAIRLLKAHHIKASLVGDWQSWMDTLTADAVVMPIDRKFEGRDAILAWAKSRPRLSRFVAPIDEVNGSGDVAYMAGRYSLSMIADDGSTLLEQGLFIDIVRKQNGQWRIARAIWHPNAPPPIAKAT
jgi:ketosteroid isomerase-like protein